MKYFFTIAYLVFALCMQAQITFYVAPTSASPAGNDNTGNGSIGSPFATIGKAVDVANTGATNRASLVTVWVRGGTYRNAAFTTTGILPVIHDPQNVGEAIWKTTTAEVVRLSNITRTATTKITIKAYTVETPIIESDGDNAFNIRNCAYITVEGLEIKGVLDRIPKQLAWLYWGTYRYTSGGSTIYGDRKTDICAQYGFSPCSDIPPNVFTHTTTDFPTYRNLANINSLNVERPNIFGGKGLLVQLSNNIEVSGCNVHHFPGGGMRATTSDFVTFKNNLVHHNTSRSSVGTHGLVVEGLTDDSGDHSMGVKALISGNTVYSNYNEIYSWVQTKTICTAEIDEGKGICLLRTSPDLSPPSGFSGIIRVENNISYDNGKSGIHCNDIDRAEIFNNTVYSNAHSNINDPDITSTGTNAGISIQSSTNVKINNNIVVVPTGVTPTLVALAKCQTGCETGTLANNLIYGGSNEFGSGSTTASPMFMNMAANDVRLQSTSPAINQGTNAAGQFAITDFTGATRSGVPDMGAYEYQPPLAVELLGFNAVLMNKKVDLLWSVADEKDVSQYIIERSFDGKTFDFLNKSDKGIFLTTDNNPQSGTNYYRLKIVELDGLFTYSPIRSAQIELGQNNNFKVYSNPTSDVLNIQCQIESPQVIDFELINLIGQTVHSHQLNAKEGYSQLQIATRLFPAGLYSLRIKQGNTVTIKRVVVQ
jgi:hypothetical protein